MAINGSLETFSLPELFQIIESGRKSGRLKFTPGLKNKDPHIKGTFEIWFDKGNFVAIVNSLQDQSLIVEVKKYGWIEAKHLVKGKYASLSSLKAFGTYIKEQNLVNDSQISLLFTTQINEVLKLFNVNFAWFQFEDSNDKGIIPSDGETFPWKEMTGKQKKPTELSLEGMRNLLDWSRFKEAMPPSDCGLQKLAKNCDLHLNSIEQHLWNNADGSISLKKLSQRINDSFDVVQQTALTMIFAGLVEEVSIINSAMKMATVSKYNQTPILVNQRNIATVIGEEKLTTNNSLIGNLVSFLKNNF